MPPRKETGLKKSMKGLTLFVDRNRSLVEVAAGSSLGSDYYSRYYNLKFLPNSNPVRSFFGFVLNKFIIKSDKIRLWSLERCLNSPLKP